MLSKTTLFESNVNTNLSTNLLLATVPWDLTTPKPVKQEILGIVSAFNSAELRILNIILLLCNRYKLVYATQKTIARMAKVSRGYLNIVLQKLTDLGLIAKKWNGHNKSCWYKASTWFRNPFVQESLSKKLPIFYFTIAMLISSANADITRCIKDLSLLYPSTTKATTSSTTILSKTKKGKEMFETQTEVSEQILKLNLKLTIQQQQQLSRFPAEVITRAEARLKSKKNAKDPVSYFFWLCKEELANPTKAKEVASSYNKPAEEVRKPVAWKNTEAVKPVRTITNVMEDIEKIKARELPQFMTGEGMLFPPSLKEKILANLYEELAKLTEIEPKLEEVIAEQPKAQEVIKDSATVKFDYKEAYTEKYKNHEQADQIKAWLETVDYEQQEEVFD